MKRIVLCHDADLALLELEKPVKGAEDLAVCQDIQESGKRVWIGGFGLSGPVGSPKAIGTFRAGHNRVDGLRNGKLSISLSRPDAEGCEKDEALLAIFDSGSPMFLETRAGWRLAGIASTASNRSEPKYGDRGNYARLCSHIDWLEETIRK